MKPAMTRAARAAPQACPARVVASPAFAHLGRSGHDADHAPAPTGRVERSSDENPHATITLVAGGRTDEVALAAVSRMEARGASREAVGVGRQVAATACPSRTHERQVRAGRIGVDAAATPKTVELR